MPTGVQLGLGVRTTSVSVMLSQGALAQTGGDLDLAIEGKGYLEVTMPNGAAAFTRDGGLKRSGDGLIVTSDGFPVVPDVTIPDDARSISINAEGEVYAYFTDRVQPELLGQFTIAGFTNPKGLEDSSVDPVREVTDLIEAQRGYELNSKVITAADQMLGSMVQIR